ncbi:MAG: hypothetical protein GEU88_09385 [Solirubrobacterales bacterium]|nr:hypothetical protein [Solirubrobacterales bacterium]
MNRDQIIERETRWAKRVGYAAIAIVPLYIGSIILDPQGGAVPLAGLDTERFVAIDANSGGLLLSALARSLAFALMTVPLLYVFRAAQARSPRVSSPMIGFVFIGPILLAAQGLISWAAQVQVASDFVSRLGPGGDIYTLLDGLIDDSTMFDVAANLLFPAILGLIVAMVYVPLQAMRVGLMSRFFSTLGMALGASTLFIVPSLSLLALTLWFGWLGFTIIGRAPQGRPPAWDAGEAVPWPKPGEEPAEQKGAAVVEGDAAEVFEQPHDHSARRERAKKRKRKRRQ